ncbi:MAG: hypothetical protein ACRC30_15695 [Clostridium sp.]
MEDYLKKYITIEKIRADIDAYDERILTDPNRGHWDLFDLKEEDFLKIGNGVYRRDPRLDINEEGVVAIDFGTKSTVVAYQNDEEYTLPMRVGIGKLRKEVQAYQYENPTVMEFIDLDTFIKDYKLKKGRPMTKWNSLTVSHTAVNSSINSSSENYYSYFSDLKKWCGEKSKPLKLRDKMKNEYTLQTFLDVKSMMELEEGELNPVEIYAYYLGMYINNMFRGIYMNYIMSFPVAYEKEIREKILECFRNGFKKALPVTLLEDDEVMKKFSVIDGANEPAAYAITALQEYELEPLDDKEIFFGIFDFGGGTTDFDFGIWREPNGKKERRYDYVIEHFGSGSDRYLGGENLLELLAFNVFKENIEELRTNGICFNKPVFCREFVGAEAIISTSEEARLNMRIVKEKLRPITERHEGYEGIYNKGVVGVNLYNDSGNSIANFQLKIDLEELEKILAERIEKGIRNFFESLMNVFNSGIEALNNVRKINIFLAGNSSKSELVESIFKKYIEIQEEEMKNAIGIEDIFSLYPPLGTEKAYKLMRERGIEVNEDELEKPNGKTGVAFGLIECRKGGKIRVINHNANEEGEAKFKYYIGESKKKKLKTYITPKNEYNQWIPFIDAGEDTFELFYTMLPEAEHNDLDIKETKKMKVVIENVDEEAEVFIRAISPTKIEYAVGMEDEINDEKYIQKPKVIELS